MYENVLWKIASVDDAAERLADMLLAAAEKRADLANNALLGAGLGAGLGALPTLMGRKRRSTMRDMLLGAGVGGVGAGLGTLALGAAGGSNGAAGAAGPKPAPRSLMGDLYDNHTRGMAKVGPYVQELADRVVTPVQEFNAGGGIGALPGALYDTYGKPLAQATGDLGRAAYGTVAPHVQNAANAVAERGGQLANQAWAAATDPATVVPAAAGALAGGALSQQVQQQGVRSAIEARLTPAVKVDMRRQLLASGMSTAATADDATIVREFARRQLANARPAGAAPAAVQVSGTNRIGGARLNPAAYGAIMDRLGVDRIDPTGRSGPLPAGMTPVRTSKLRSYGRHALPIAGALAGANWRAIVNEGQEMFNRQVAPPTPPPTP